MAKREDKYKPRKDGRYSTNFRTGRYHDDGSPEIILVYAKTSRELEEKVAELKYLRKTGNLIVPSNIMFGAYCKKWLATKKKRSINTYAMYENAVLKHIIPSLGNIMAKNISRTNCQQLIDARFENYETCNKLKLTMKQIQKSLIYDKIITDEFWINIEMPKKPATVKRPLTELEKKAVRLADFTMDEKVFVYLLFGCGLRREEAIALNCSVIDLKQRLISVRQVIVFDKHKPVLESRAKSSDGIRSVPIPIDFFPTIQFYVMSLMKRTTDKPEDTFLFTTKGGLLTKSSYDKLWNRIVRKLNWAVLDNDMKEKILQDKEDNHRLSIYKEMENRCNGNLPIQGLTAHIFRHNYATLLYYSGISELKAVELMGHSDGKMIREVYAHLDEKKENTVVKLDSSISLIS